MKFKLVKPDVRYKSQIETVRKEVEKSNQKDAKWYFKIDDFKKYVERKNREFIQEGLLKGLIATSTFWMVDDKDNYIGRISVRHSLSPHLRILGGHIGYDIRPSERGKGYGSEMLKLALLEVKKLGLKKVLITCDKDNVGSWKVIENNGGKDREEDVVDGVEILRYWIDIK